MGFGGDDWECEACHVEWLSLAAPVARLGFEESDDGGATEAAVAVVEVVGSEFVPIAFDQQFAAVGAVGALPWRVVDVSDVGVLQAGFECDVSSGDQCFVGCAGSVQHAEVGMECGEVDRDAVADVFENPVAHPFQFVGAVVFVGDQQVGDFEPDVGFVFEPDEGVEDGLEL